MAFGTPHRRKTQFAAALAASMIFAAPAFAQDADDTARRALDLNTGFSSSDILNLSSSLDGALADLPSDLLAEPRVEFSADPCLTSLLDCLQTRPAFDTIGPFASGQTLERPGLDYARAFSAGDFIGLDLELEPRAAFRFSGEEDSALVGAIVRIGEDLKAGEVKSNSWYLFAGADAEAMHYTPGGFRNFTAGEFALQDRVIVGDAQAGIGYRLGDADLSVGYYRREVSSLEDNDPANDFSISEDAAAISFTWRR